MRKAGLCLRYDCNNYGSMLQIFATQRVIENLGWKYEIIVYDKKTISFLVKNITRIFNPYFMRGKIISLNRKIKLRKHSDEFKNNMVRLKCFQKFRNMHIGPYSITLKGEKQLVKSCEKYDAVIVGSDQLWTPAGLQSNFYNLLFVPNNIKKISFATSFGVTQIPKYQINKTKKYLMRIDYLSTREISGANLVKALTGREATVAADPTLLLSKEEWEEFFPFEKQSEEPYIFAYFLGTSKQHRELVEELAVTTKLKIITCPHLDEFVESDLNFGDEQRFDVGPIEFLNLIRGAKYICTDSFHGTVFSILNHKKFITFDRYTDAIRKSKNTRISSLFSLLGLEDRHSSCEVGSVFAKIEKTINYDDVDKKLVELRRSTLKFMNKALNE